MTLTQWLLLWLAVGAAVQAWDWERDRDNINDIKIALRHAVTAGAWVPVATAAIFLVVLTTAEIIGWPGVLLGYALRRRKR